MKKSIYYSHAGDDCFKKIGIAFSRDDAVDVIAAVRYNCLVDEDVPLQVEEKDSGYYVTIDGARS